jgi:hypothetical protein
MAPGERRQAREILRCEPTKKNKAENRDEERECLRENRGAAQQIFRLRNVPKRIFHGDVERPQSQQDSATGRNQPAQDRAEQAKP